jgi:FkbM family methyltransferase
MQHLTRLGLTAKGAIHVGASTGQEVSAYKDAGMEPAIFFEALPGPFAQLKSRIGDTPSYTPVNACLSDVEGKTVKFNPSSNGGQSSSYLTPTGHKTLYPRITFDEPIEMTTSTLDAEIGRWERRTGRSASAFDYLAMDVQGAELHVLKGGAETLKHIKYIWTEVSLGGMYEGDPTVYEMIDFMRGAGFDIFQLELQKRRWGDCLFIRNGVVTG